MLSTRLGRLIHLVLAGVLVVSAVLLMNAHRRASSRRSLAMDPDRAAETYHERMKATDVLLKTERLDLSSY